ncbi:ARM repeat superfamily protein [Zea mays]|uniref:ARM repeat superfamily protein n=2 Tax=Zea mays TaxID=4577 RepID=A0A1D6HDW5_MAIZE|nr:ARM repeat superfamily protein [Zea mays]
MDEGILEMCLQHSRARLPPDKQLAAEKSFALYCKPVELYNIIQRRAIKNHSPIYRINRACLLTNFSEFGNKDKTEATFIISVDLASYLHRLQPRLLKLLRSNAFKAKPALITLIGACAAMGANAEVTASITCLRDAIASDDWAARKAAAEALAALALEHTDLLTTYKSSCVTFFEARRFDKVKVVQESMNQMIEAGKEIPGAEEDECSSLCHQRPSHNEDLLLQLGKCYTYFFFIYKLSCNYSGSASDGRYPAASLGSNSVPLATRKSILSVSRSSLSDVSTSVIFWTFSRLSGEAEVVLRKRLVEQLLISLINS